MLVVFSDNKILPCSNTFMAYETKWMVCPFLCLSCHIKREDIALMLSFLIDETSERMSLVYPSSNWLYLPLSKAPTALLEYHFNHPTFPRPFLRHLSFKPPRKIKSKISPANLLLVSMPDSVRKELRLGCDAIEEGLKNESPEKLAEDQLYQ